MLDNNNPEKLPLTKLKLSLTDSDGVKRQVPALDKHWVVKRDKPFQIYSCLLSSYGSIKTGAALEEWQFIATQCRQDLEFLLALNHHEFWSYMVFEDTSLDTVVTFLQRANPYYRHQTSGNSNTTTSIDSLYNELLNLVVRVLMRLVTSEESPTEWIEAEEHGHLLYNYFLISVPLLFDLAIAVGDGDDHNVAILKQIFTALLLLQPDYLVDLNEGLGFYENAFLTMQIQVENEGCEGAGGGMLICDDADTPYDDVVLFALDCAYTLRVLLNICPALLPLFELLKLPQGIANFYDLTVPTLYKNICQVNPQAASLKWLNEVRQQFLHVVHMVTRAQLALAQREPSAGSGQRMVELLQECLSSQTFVVDFQRQYSIEQNIREVLQCCPNIKDYKVDFVVEGYQKALSNSTNGIMADELASTTDSDDLESCTSSTPATDAAVIVKTPTTTATATSIKRDIDLEVSAVLDVLPDLGMGFIRRVLARYENSEEAIAAILDDNLPPDFAHFDRNEIYVPPDMQDQLQQQTGVRHFNVHDGDKYDVLTQDDPQCIIKRGKGLPGRPRNAEQLLDDKQHIAELKERYQKYCLVEDTATENAEYSDEYDDSYEAFLDGQALPQHNPNKQHRAVGIDDGNDSDGSNSGDSVESSQDTTTTTRRRPPDFCENPEITRARYAARQQAKYGSRNTQPRGDGVVGAPKGQGQTTETQRQRGHKEAHKSSRANHNRKAGAAFKRNKGMIS